MWQPDRHKWVEIHMYNATIGHRTITTRRQILACLQNSSWHFQQNFAASFFNSAEDRTFVASVYIFCLGLCAQLYTCHTQNSNQPAPRSTRSETEEKPRSTGTRSCTHRRFINGNPGYICTITIIFVNAETGLLTRSAAPDVLNWTVRFS